MTRAYSQGAPGQSKAQGVAVAFRTMEPLKKRVYLELHKVFSTFCGVHMYGQSSAR